MITGSNMSRVLAMSAAYMRDIIAARTAGEQFANRFANSEIDSPATAWGHRWESAALAAYSFATGLEVTPAGFLIHPLFGYIGGTLDGLVGPEDALDSGGVEVKCHYRQEYHLEAAEWRILPAPHMAQVQAYLWITGRAWWDYVSFDPRAPCGDDLVIVRVLPDLEYRATMARRCQIFWQHVLSGNVPESLTTVGQRPIFFKKGVIT